MIPSPWGKKRNLFILARIAKSRKTQSTPETHILCRQVIFSSFFLLMFLEQRINLWPPIGRLLGGHVQITSDVRNLEVLATGM